MIALPVTYEPIATTTISTATTTIDFTNIPGTYTDLEFVIFGKAATSVRNIDLRFNGDTGTRYSNTVLFGNGTSAVSARQSDQTLAPAGFMTTTGSLTIVKLFNYSNSTTAKTILCRAGDASDSTAARVCLWRAVSNAAITSINVIATGNFDTGSILTLYGIKAA